MNNGFARFAYWLSRAMSGRHGNDQLSVALLVLYCILLAIGGIFHLPFLTILALLALVLSIYRMLSRNNAKRWKENEWFLSWWGPFWHWLRGVSSHFHSSQEYAQMKARDRGTYKYYKCPKCKNKLRVPRGKGKIAITCPVCHTEFIRKT